MPEHKAKSKAEYLKETCSLVNLQPLWKLDHSIKTIEDLKRKRRLIMKNGFRVPAQSSKKEQQRKTDAELQNIQMASRISQMMIQQLMENLKSMSQDLGSAINQIYELQYKYTALQKHLNLDVEALNEIANAQRLVDFDEASAKADTQENLELAESVDTDSTVVITSVAADDKNNDRGIFRSRIKLSDSGVPELINELTGKKVGDKVQVKLNNIQHEVELLSIRSPKKEPLNEVTH